MPRTCVLWRIITESNTIKMKEFKFALKQTFPILFTYVFLGIAFGMMMTEAGYSTLVSVICAVVIFAGSMQIAMVALLQAGTPLLMVAVMTLFINGRHLFYGVGLIDRFRKMGWRYPYMVFALTDETYSILCSCQYPDDIDRNNADFFIALLNQSYWVLGCFIGGIAGTYLPFDFTGIDFSATAFFLVVVITQLQQCKSKIPTVVGFISSIVFLLLLGPDRFLIPSLSVSMITLAMMRDIVSRRMEGIND